MSKDKKNNKFTSTFDAIQKAIKKYCKNSNKDFSRAAGEPDTVFERIFILYKNLEKLSSEHDKENILISYDDINSCFRDSLKVVVDQPIKIKNTYQLKESIKKAFSNKFDRNNADLINSNGATTLKKFIEFLKEYLTNFRRNEKEVFDFKKMDELIDVKNIPSKNFNKEMLKKLQEENKKNEKNKENEKNKKNIGIIPSFSGFVFESQIDTSKSDQTPDYKKLKEQTVSTEKPKPSTFQKTIKTSKSIIPQSLKEKNSLQDKNKNENTPINLNEISDIYVPKTEQPQYDTLDKNQPQTSSSLHISQLVLSGVQNEENKQNKNDEKNDESKSKNSENNNSQPNPNVENKVKKFQQARDEYVESQTSELLDRNKKLSDENEQLKTKINLLSTELEQTNNKLLNTQNKLDNVQILMTSKVSMQDAETSTLPQDELEFNKKIVELETLLTNYENLVGQLQNDVNISNSNIDELKKENKAKDELLRSIKCAFEHDKLENFYKLREYLENNPYILRDLHDMFDIEDFTIFDLNENMDPKNYTKDYRRDLFNQLIDQLCEKAKDKIKEIKDLMEKGKQFQVVQDKYLNSRFSKTEVLSASSPIIDKQSSEIQTESKKLSQSQILYTINNSKDNHKLSKLQLSETQVTSHEKDKNAGIKKLSLSQVNSANLASQKNTIVHIDAGTQHENTNMIDSSTQKDNENMNNIGIQSERIEMKDSEVQLDMPVLKEGATQSEMPLNLSNSKVYSSSFIPQKNNVGIQSVIPSIDAAVETNDNKINAALSMNKNYQEVKYNKLDKLSNKDIQTEINTKDAEIQAEHIEMKDSEVQLDIPVLEDGATQSENVVLANNEVQTEPQVLNEVAVQYELNNVLDQGTQTIKKSFEISNSIQNIMNDKILINTEIQTDKKQLSFANSSQTINNNKAATSEFGTQTVDETNIAIEPENSLHNLSVSNVSSTDVSSNKLTPIKFGDKLWDDANYIVANKKNINNNKDIFSEMNDKIINNKEEKSMQEQNNTIESNDDLIRKFWQNVKSKIGEVNIIDKIQNDDQELKKISDGIDEIFENYGPDIRKCADNRKTVEKCYEKFSATSTIEAARNICKAFGIDIKDTKDSKIYKSGDKEVKEISNKEFIGLLIVANNKIKNSKDVVKKIEYEKLLKQKQIEKKIEDETNKMYYNVGEFLKNLKHNKVEIEQKENEQKISTKQADKKVHEQSNSEGSQKGTAENLNKIKRKQEENKQPISTKQADKEVDERGNHEDLKKETAEELDKKIAKTSSFIIANARLVSSSEKRQREKLELENQKAVQSDQNVVEQQKDEISYSPQIPQQKQSNQINTILQSNNNNQNNFIELYRGSDINRAADNLQNTKQQQINTVQDILEMLSNKNVDTSSLKNIDASFFDQKKEDIVNKTSEEDDTNASLPEKPRGEGAETAQEKRIELYRDPQGSIKNVIYNAYLEKFNKEEDVVEKAKLLAILNDIAQYKDADLIKLLRTPVDLQTVENSVDSNQESNENSGDVLNESNNGADLSKAIILHPDSNFISNSFPKALSPQLINKILLKNLLDSTLYFNKKLNFGNQQNIVLSQVSNEEKPNELKNNTQNTIEPINANKPNKPLITGVNSYVQQVNHQQQLSQQQVVVPVVEDVKSNNNSSQVMPVQVEEGNLSFTSVHSQQIRQSSNRTDRRKLQSNIDNTAKDDIKDNVKEEKEAAKDVVKDVVKDKNNYKNYFSLSFYRADKDNVLTPYSIDNDISNEALNSQLNNDFTNYINDLSKYINNNLQNNSASNLFSLTDNVKLANLENELKEKEELLKAVSEEVNVENNEKEIASNSSEQTQIQIDISYLEREIEKLKKENVQKTISKTIAEKAKEANIEFGTIATLTYNKDDNGNTTDKATISLFEFGNKEKSKDYISYTELELTNGDIVRIRDINNDKIKNFLKEGEIEEEVLKTYLKNDFFITIQRKGSEKEELIKYDDEIENGYSCSDLFDLPEKVKQNYQDLEKEEKDLEKDENIIQAIENDSISSLLQDSSSNIYLSVEEGIEEKRSKSFAKKLNKDNTQHKKEVYNIIAR